MRTIRVRHALALVTAAALLATMTAATVAAPASAAKPKCQGKTATIVGTRKGERIVGTARRDVIVAKGGHDRIFGRGGNDLICAGGGNDTVYGSPGADTIWGQLGNDRLFGNAGPDFLAGQVGNDHLNGGISLDKCYQGTGGGPRVACELPAEPVAPPPAPPEPSTLVVAYGDVNTNHLYDAGDVMIAEIVDTNGDGAISPGDTIKMGQYPTSPSVIAPARVVPPFENWQVSEHVLMTGDLVTHPDTVRVHTTIGNEHFWTRAGVPTNDRYYEQDATVSYVSWMDDDTAPGDFDEVVARQTAPSQAMSDLDIRLRGDGDDGFIDVEIYVP